MEHKSCPLKIAESAQMFLPVEHRSNNIGFKISYYAETAETVQKQWSML